MMATGEIKMDVVINAELNLDMSAQEALILVLTLATNSLLSVLFPYHSKTM